MNDIGKRIKETREASGIMAKHVAKSAGISPWYLSMIENGKRVPSLDKLKTIAAVLGVDMAQFFLDHQVSDSLNDMGSG